MYELKVGKIKQLKMHIISRLKNSVSEKFKEKEIKLDYLIQERKKKLKGGGIFSSMINDYRNGDVSISTLIVNMLAVSSPLVLLGFSFFSFFTDSFYSSGFWASTSVITAFEIARLRGKETIAELKLEEYSIKKKNLIKDKLKKEEEITEIFKQDKIPELMLGLNDNIDLETLNKMKDVFSEEELKLLILKLKDNGITYQNVVDMIKLNEKIGNNEVDYEDVINLIKSIKNEDKTEMIYKSLFEFKKEKDFKVIKDKHYA